MSAAPAETAMNARELGLLAAGVALVAGLVLVPILRRVAVATGTVDAPDKPGGRKFQRRPVPLLGGVAVALAAGVGLLAVGWDNPEARTSFPKHAYVLVAAGLTFLIGLVDDIFKDRIGPLPKFIGQFIAVGVLFGENWMQVFQGEASGGAVFHVLALTLWFLTVVNAVNFVDNMNGLCSGVATISLLVGLVGVAGIEKARWAVLAGALGGGMLAFMPYNYPKARIYLGDAGSHLAGFFLALLSVEFTAGFLSANAKLYGLDAFIPAMLLLGLPLFDLLFSVVRRYREKRPLFHGDARHLSHRLVGAGLDPASAVMLLWGVHLIVAASGVVAFEYAAPGRWTIFAVILTFLSILAAILVRIERNRRGGSTGGQNGNGTGTSGADPSAGRISEPAGGRDPSLFMTSDI